MKFLAILTLLTFLLPLSKDPPEYAEMTFENTIYTFDTVNQGEDVISEFRFTNTGKIPLTVFTYKTSCGCQMPLEWPREPVPPGESGTIRSKLSTKGRQGQQSKGSTIHANIKNQTIFLNMKGYIRPPQNK